MTNLSKAHCEACHADAPPVTDAELATFLQQLPDWGVQDRNGVLQLERQFRFQDFQQALAFTQAVGELAEQEGHHPALLTEWGKVTVTWWTHKIGGLHRNDFVMAARTDELARQSTGQFSSLVL